MKSITSESRDGDFATPLMSASMRQFDEHANDVMIPTVNAFTRQQHIPNAQLIIYPDSGHASHFQYPDLFLQHARLFLDS